MKKLIMMALAMCTMVGFADNSATTDTKAPAGIYDVYKFKASLKVPYLDKGVRAYKSQTFTGTMVAYWTDYESPVENVTIVMTNKKTKVEHVINVTDGFINILGKKMDKPSVACMSDTVVSTATGTRENHETIKFITFAGTGSTKKMKIADAVGCDSCGVGGSAAEYCYKITKLSGSVTGYMNCECPDGFDHTMSSTACGQGIEPMHEGAFWGSWSVSRNSKKSYVIAE